MFRRAQRSTLFPYTTLFRSLPVTELVAGQYQPRMHMDEGALYELAESIKSQGVMQPILVRQLSSGEDRKSTRLNSSHVKISYAVFCLKKKIEDSNEWLVLWD